MRRALSERVLVCLEELVELQPLRSAPFPSMLSVCGTFHKRDAGAVT